jgi:tetratricopeptide (TPR) repeat protein
MYDEQGEYEKALDCYRQQLVISEKLGYPQGRAQALLNIGTAHQQRGDYPAAMECFRQNLVLVQALDDRQGLCATYSNMGVVHYCRGDFAEAISCYQRCLVLSEQLQYQESIGVTLGNLGSVHRSMKDYVKAEECFDRAITICRELHLKYYLCDYLYNKAELCTELGRNEDAGRLINEVRQHMDGSQAEQREIISQCALLEAAILFRTNPMAAIEKARSLLQEARQDDERATVHYQLFKMTGYQSHRKAAFALYLKLHAKMPRHDYQVMLTELDDAEGCP